MKALRTVLIGAAASAALLATGAVGYAQTRTAEQGRVIQVPPGAVVLVLPAGTMPAAAIGGAPLDVAFPFADMPSPAAMIQQMDQMMADMQRSFASPAWLDPNRVIQAAMQGMPDSGPVTGVVVTSFSNGHGTCTQRITYSGNGTAPVVHVAATGDACSAVGAPSGAMPVPAAMPRMQAPAPEQAPAGMHLLQVRDTARPAPAPLVYAQAGQ